MKRRETSPRTVIVVSDLHCGCRLGLCPDEPVALDDGGWYQPSTLQKKMHHYWRLFWKDWVPSVTQGEPYILVVNGDALDGVHHGSKTQVSQNFADQHAIATRLLEPVVKTAHTYFHVRGTEAHVGKSAEQEELLARSLGAKPDENGNHARWELWLDLRGYLCHFTHHIGTTGSSAYESTAIWKEKVEAYVDAGRWDRKPPQVTVRSHRHRAMEVRAPARHGYSVSVVTPAWQLKTPFSHRIAGARQTQPQVGGVMIRAGDRILYTDSKVWDMERPHAEVVE